MNIIGKRTNHFEIGYMFNPKLHGNKAFRDQVKNY